MAENMTLEEVRDQLRAELVAFDKLQSPYALPLKAYLAQWSDAIDAHLAGVNALIERALDAAAFLNALGRHDCAQPLRDAVHAIRPELAKSMAPTSTVGLATPACGDRDAVREVIAELRRDARAFPISSFERARLTANADKLTAALPENAK